MLFTQKEIPCDTPNKCVFNVGPGSSTCLYFPPSYNRAGENLNPDGNTMSYSVGCSACGKGWFVSERLGVKTISPTKQD